MDAKTNRLHTVVYEFLLKNMYEQADEKTCDKLQTALNEELDFKASVKLNMASGGIIQFVIKDDTDKVYIVDVESLVYGKN